MILLYDPTIYYVLHTIVAMYYSTMSFNCSLISQYVNRIHTCALIGEGALSPHASILGRR